jgi:hypothetical protein
VAERRRGGDLRYFVQQLLLRAADEAAQYDRSRAESLHLMAWRQSFEQIAGRMCAQKKIR